MHRSLVFGSSILGRSVLVLQVFSIDHGQPGRDDCVRLPETMHRQVDFVSPDGCFVPMDIDGATFYRGKVIPPMGLIIKSSNCWSII